MWRTGLLRRGLGFLPTKIEKDITERLMNGGVVFESFFAIIWRDKLRLCSLSLTESHYYCASSRTQLDHIGVFLVPNFKRGGTDGGGYTEAFKVGSLYKVDHRF